MCPLGPANIAPPSPVGVSCDLIAHHDTVHQPFSQEPRIIMSQLHCGQLPKVLMLNTHTHTEGREKKSVTGLLLN